MDFKEDERLSSVEDSMWPRWARVIAWGVAAAIAVTIAVSAVLAIQSGLFEKLLDTFL